MPGRIVTNQRTGERAWLENGQLMPLTPQMQRQAATGFYGGPSSAPDAIAARQEYANGVKSLADDSASYKRAVPMRAQLERFSALNRQVRTGGLYAIPKVAALVAAMTGNSKLQEMDATAGLMQVTDVPKGQGQVSNFERELFAKGHPSVGQLGTTNGNIVAAKRALFNAEGDRLAFREAYLRNNQTLNGADQAWDRYVAANPYSYTDAKGRIGVLGQGQRTAWEDYFGVRAAPARPAVQRPPPGAGRPPLASFAR